MVREIEKTHHQAIASNTGGLPLLHPAGGARHCSEWKIDFPRRSGVSGERTAAQ